MSPYVFYQFWINRTDAEMPGLLRVFTFRDRGEIEALERQTTQQPVARAAQRVLAQDLTALVHGRGPAGDGDGGEPGPVRPGRAGGAR